MHPATIVDYKAVLGRSGRWSLIAIWHCTEERVAEAFLPSEEEANRRGEAMLGKTWGDFKREARASRSRSVPQPSYEVPRTAAEPGRCLVTTEAIGADDGDSCCCVSCRSSFGAATSYVRVSATDDTGAFVIAPVTTWICGPCLESIRAGDCFPSFHWSSSTGAEPEAWKRASQSVSIK